MFIYIIFILPHIWTFYVALKDAPKTILSGFPSNWPILIKEDGMHYNICQLTVSKWQNTKKLGSKIGRIGGKQWNVISI